MNCTVVILHSFAIFVFPHKFVGISSDETENLYPPTSPNLNGKVFNVDPI